MAQIRIPMNSPANCRHNNNVLPEARPSLFTNGTMHLFIFCAILLTSLRQQLHAQTYYRDSTFGALGIAIPNSYSYPLGARSHQARKILLQPDGKILLVGAIAGQTPVEIVRLNINGTVDTTYGQRGYFQGYGLSGQTLHFVDAALAPDGKVMVCYLAISASLSNTMLYRISANGTLDNTFGAGGQVTLTDGPSSGLNRILFQPDGKAILGGSKNIGQVNYYVIYRLNTNGAPDNTFGLNGRIENTYPQYAAASTVAAALARQKDGKILMFTFISPATAAGARSAVIRFKTNGTVDSGFAVNGCREIDSTDLVPSMALATDSVTGDIYAFASAETPQPSIVKLNANGALVNSFGANGHAVVNAVSFSQVQGVYGYPASMLRQTNGKFLFAGISDTGAASHTVICRLDANGQLDNSFCNAGILALPRNVRDVHMAAAVQANGDILLAGTTYGKMANRFPWDSTFMYVMRITDGSKPIVHQGIATRVSASGNIHAYPNPVDGGNIHLSYDGIDPATALRVDLCDMAGRIISTWSFPVGTASGQLDLISAHALPAGMYLLKAYSGAAGYPVIRLTVAR